MADAQQQIADGFKRAVDAQMRYYQALGNVTTEYLKTLMSIWTDAPLPINLGPFRPTASTAPAATPAAAATPALVLEAEQGQQAHGAFMVENKLSRAVSAPVVTSAFIGPDGRELRPTMRVEPGIVSLEPGAKALVQIIATISEDLAAGAAYQGEVSVPGLSNTRVPLVLRRRESASPPVTPEPATKTKTSRAKRKNPKADDSITN